MIVYLSAEAEQDLEAIGDYIARDNPGTCGDLHPGAAHQLYGPGHAAGEALVGSTI